jgi:hypothetical protein
MRPGLRRMLPFAAILLCSLVAAGADHGDYTFARDLVGRAQDDLRRAADFAREGAALKDGKQIERFSNAQRSLSKFDRDLSKGKFEKDELDDAIRDLNNVLEHNTLSSQDRDALTKDLRDLRLLRTSRGKPF